MLFSRYKQFILFVCLINFVAYVIYDYSPRIGHDASRYNWTSWALELLCTIIFTFDFFLRSIGMGLLLGRGTLLKSFFGCYYLLILIARYIKNCLYIISISIINIIYINIYLYVFYNEMIFIYKYIYIGLFIFLPIIL
jgi:hypothetical protein